ARTRMAAPRRTGDPSMSSTAKPVAGPKPSTTSAFTAKSYAVRSPTSKFAPQSIQRRAPGTNDVHIEILFCGVCHSDLHQAKNEWKDVMPTVYPCLPGHELAGHVGR